MMGKDKTCLQGEIHELQIRLGFYPWRSIRADLYETLIRSRMGMMQEAGICRYNVIDGELINREGYRTIYTNPKMPKTRIKQKGRKEEKFRILEDIECDELSRTIY